MIIESHKNDPHYLESRAIEMILEARLDMLYYHERMTKAITLLGLARLIRGPMDLGELGPQGVKGDGYTPTIQELQNRKENTDSHN